MQVSVENTGEIGRRVTVSVPAEEFEKTFTGRLKRMSRQIKMPGFRPGKVPLKMVEAQYGGQISREVTGELIQTSLQQALGQEGLRPAGNPRIETKSMGRGETLEYVAEFDIYPEIKKLDLEGIEILVPECEVADEDVDRTLQTMRKQRRIWKPVDRAARDQDQVTIDFVGTIDGEPFKGGEAKGVPLVLGSGTMIPGFEKGILGATPGETRDVKVTFPEHYQAENLAGKAAVFAVTVHEVAEGQLPEIDAEFVKQFGVESGDPEELSRGVRENLEREAGIRTRNLVRSRVLEALEKANNILLPQSLVDNEMAQIRSQDARQRQTQGLPAASETENAIYEAQARRRVALGLIIGEIVRKQNIQPDAGLVRQRVEELASGYENPAALMAWYYEKPERLAEIESLVMEEQVVADVLKTANQKKVPVGFQDLLQESGLRG